jgi:putative acetyltransferase
MVTIRDYQPSDAGVLMELFHRTVHAVCGADYTAAELDAWSPVAGQDVLTWSARFEIKRPFVATIGPEIVGFIELEAGGHIGCLYVHHGFQRRGVGTRLLEHAIVQAHQSRVPRLYAEVSVTALPFFERHEFSLIRRQEVERHGQRLENFVMVRTLTSPVAT